MDVNHYEYDYLYLLLEPHLEYMLSKWELCVAVLIGLDLPFQPLTFCSHHNGEFVMDDPGLYRLMDEGYPGLRGALVAIQGDQRTYVMDRLLRTEIDTAWLRWIDRQWDRITRRDDDDEEPEGTHDQVRDQISQASGATPQGIAVETETADEISGCHEAQK